MSLNSNALTTVARLKALPGMASISDAKAQEAINLASNAVENYLGRKLGYSSGIVESLQGSGERKLYLSRFPIHSVQSILHNGEEIDLEELKVISGIEDSNQEGWLYRKKAWPIEVEDRNPLCEPEILTDAYPFEVTYTAGYRLPNSEASSIEALPFEIQLAAEATAYEWLRESGSAFLATGSPKVTSERTAGGYSVTYEKDSGQNQQKEIQLPTKAKIYLADIPTRKRVFF